ncbi:MAG: CHRD domain-containing protein [Nitrospirae bacterium]|nr:CHRD domain-containing protein [Candidatus Manganitrophaceae bacterium]
MKKYLFTLFAGAALILLQARTALSIDDLSGLLVPPPGSGPVSLVARLSGFSEVPALSSPGTGRFTATVSADRTTIRYTLTYSGTESDVFMAHIHFGQIFANGGISIWFCGNPSSPVPPPAGVSVSPCPLSGTLQGTITAADVIGPAGQGISATQFDELVRALLRGLTYVNVHSLKYIPGEIRGQIVVQRFGLLN